MTRKVTIYLEYDPPPVPTRDMDWSAADDDREGEQHFGATPWEALRALADAMEESGQEFAGVKYPEVTA